jgi:hypothetical protein
MVSSIITSVARCPGLERADEGEARQGVPREGP